MRWAGWLGAVALACLWPAAARAGDWVYTPPEADEQAFQRWRWAAATGVWIGTYTRPQRACREVRATSFELEARGLARRPLRAAQAPFPFPFFDCPFEASEEVGISAAASVAYRTFAPVYLTLGLELVYTQPSYSTLKNQVVVALPFGILVTWYEWKIRPIAQLSITPMAFLPDGGRDFTLGGELGLAYRVLTLGDVALTVGHHWSDTVSPWTVRLALHPL
jgi:hypothetical protein